MLSVVAVGCGVGVGVGCLLSLATPSLKGMEGLIGAGRIWGGAGRGRGRGGVVGHRRGDNLVAVHGAGVCCCCWLLLMMSAFVGIVVRCCWLCWCWHWCIGGDVGDVGGGVLCLHFRCCRCWLFLWSLLLMLCAARRRFWASFCCCKKHPSYLDVSRLRLTVARRNRCQ